MSLAEKILQLYIRRMSQAEKEALLEKAVSHFFEGMSAQEKQQLLENMLQKILDDVDVKEFLPRIMAMLWKGVKTDEERTSILSTMGQLASDTGGQIIRYVSEDVLILGRFGAKAVGLSLYKKSCALRTKPCPVFSKSSRICTFHS